MDWQEHPYWSLDIGGLTEADAIKIRELVITHFGDRMVELGA